MIRAFIKMGLNAAVVILDVGAPSLDEPLLQIIIEEMTLVVAA